MHFRINSGRLINHQYQNTKKNEIGGRRSTRLSTTITVEGYTAHAWSQPAGRGIHTMSNTNDTDSSEEQHHSDHPRMGDNRRHAEHATREGSGGARPDSEHGEHDGQDDGHGGGMHAGHEQMFKRRFFVNLVLSIPV